MSSDGYEAKVGFYVNFPRVMHTVLCDGKPICRVYENGRIVIDEPDDEPTVAHQERAPAMVGPP